MKFGLVTLGVSLTLALLRVWKLQDGLRRLDCQQSYAGGGPQMQTSLGGTLLILRCKVA